MTEQTVVDAVRLDDAWALVEELSTLVRDSGGEDERRAFDSIAARLAAWGVPHTLHRPEALISLPGRASVTVGGRRFEGKTPSMAAATEGLSGPLVHEAADFSGEGVTAQARSVDAAADVGGRVVLTEGLPLPPSVVDLERRGAAGIVLISPGERIHEGICTPVWGSPDLRTHGRKPRIPVVAVSRRDAAELIALADAGAEATLVTELDEGWRPIPVLVAEIPGAVEPERFVLLHGHVDSWHVGVGDNATGDATLLEVARVLWEHRHRLARSVRVAWWSGHSHGRYAGSTWFADAFALDLERNCVAHVNCDSPGCRDADAYEAVCAMPETAALARAAIAATTGLEATTILPVRAGDMSFTNLGLSTYLMLSSTIPAALREERDLYRVGGCGGNIEWHTEADTLEIADPDRLLRDMRMYAGAVVRTANEPVHPLDFRATVDELEQALRELEPALAPYADLAPVLAAAAECRAALEELYARAAAVETVERARPLNDALLRIGRLLVRALWTQEDRYRQDPALRAPRLPGLAAAADAIGTVPDGVIRTEVVRGRNRVEGALRDAMDLASRPLA
jgi:N-acetylated-alpha-linked acidic dipeptidase